MSELAATTIAVDVRMLGASGIGTYLDALLPRLLERLPSTRFFLLGDPEISSARPWSRGATVVPCRAPIYGPREQPALAWAIPREAEVFWSPHVNVPIAFRGRLVATVHDAYYLRPEARDEVRLDKRLYLRAMYAAVAYKAAAIACVSRFTADELVGRLGIDEARLRVVHNGVDGHWFEPIATPRPHGRPYLLFVGNARPHKNLQGLLAAFERVRERIDHDLIVVGRTYEAPRSDVRVLYAGSVPLERLRAYYAHADGLVMPSLYEGFGLPPLEAMAAGAPVLVSTEASLPEVCGEAALYCDPRSVADIAERLVELVEGGARLRALGRARARSFRWDDAADAMAELLAG